MGHGLSIAETARKVVAWALTRRRLVFLLAAAAMGPFIAYGARNLDQVDNSMHIWFEPDDPDYRYYNSFKDEFGSDELLAVAFETSDVFSPRSVEIQRAVVDALEQVIDIEEVRSLLTTSHIEGTAEGLVIEPVLPRSGPLSAEVLARAREKALSDPNLTGQLVSKDGRSVAILGRIVATEKEAIKGRITEDVKKRLAPIAAAYPDVPLYLSGSTVLDYEFDRLAERDQNVFFPLVFACTALILFIIFRRPAMALIPTVVEFAVLLATFGLFYLFNPAANMVVGMIGPVLIAVSIGDSVHILARYRALRRKLPDRTERLLATVAEEARPCFFTSVTTAAGFFSFTASDVKPVRDLGLYAGAGCLLAYLVTLLLIPLALSCLPERGRGGDAPEAAPRHRPRITGILERMARLTLERPRGVLLATVALSLLCLAGVLRVNIESSGLEFLPKSNPVREGLEFIQDRLTGLHVIEVVVETAEDGAKDPDLVRRVDQMQTYIKGLDQVSNSLSQSNYLKQINQALHEGDPAYDRVPQSREAIAQYLLLAETSGDEELAKYVNYDYSRLRVSSLAMAASSSSYDRIIERVHRAIARWLPGEQTHVTGIIPLYRKLDDMLLSSQAKSFGTAAVVIFFFMWILVGSPTLALLAMIPNVLPILLTMGFMGYVGIDIDPATVLIGGVALGIAVDDTVHYLSRYRIEMERHGDPRQAIMAVHRLVGPAIVFTSLILMAGFLVLLAGHFSPTRHFGALTALTMVFALVGDLLLLPALLLVFRPKVAGARASLTSPPAAADGPAPEAEGS